MRKEGTRGEVNHHSCVLAKISSYYCFIEISEHQSQVLGQCYIYLHVHYNNSYSTNGLSECPPAYHWNSIKCPQKLHYYLIT